MAAHSIRSVQKIPVPLEKAWAFFANPANLAQITPPSMDFRVISKWHGDRIYAGQIIEYKVRPLFGWPMYWMTEIVQVQDQTYFIDEQRKGPYRLWHHQHHFREIEGGVEMTDTVHYLVPLGWLGRLMNRLIVRKKLEAIFQYRYAQVESLFGAWPGEGKPEIQMA